MQIYTRAKSGVLSVGFFALGLIILAIAQVVFASSSGTLLPKADGNYTQWTPSTGTSHFVLVDESSCNGTTDYNSTTVVGNRDSYVVSTSTIPNGATITQIDIKPCASRVSTGGANSTMDVFYRFGGTSSADSGAYSLTGTTPIDLATTTYSGLSLLQTSTTTLEVGAVLSAGTKGARLSRVASVVTYTALTAPSSLAATASTTSAIGLTWSDNSSNESGFTIDRSLDASSWTGIATTTANTTSYYDSGLTDGTGYYYRVRAYNFGAYTNFTSNASATTTTNPPAAPSGLSATASTTKPQIVLGWTDNASNETNVEVLRGTDGINFSHLATTSANVIAYTDSSVAVVTTYYYEMRE
jgi:hypothetical protein